MTLTRHILGVTLAGAVLAGANEAGAALVAQNPNGANTTERASAAGGALAASVASAGGVWSFAPTLKLASGAQSYVYEDPPLASLISDAASVADDGYFPTFNSNSDFRRLGDDDADYAAPDSSAISEPAAWGLMLGGLGLGGLALRSRRTAFI